MLSLLRNYHTVAAIESDDNVIKILIKENCQKLKLANFVKKFGPKFKSNLANKKFKK